MNESVAQYWEKTLQYWNQFNKTQKWMIVGTTLLIILTLSLLIFHFSKTEYALAFTDLTPADAAAVTEYLDNQGIPYQFSNDNTAIGVPSKDVNHVKINVAGQNLVHNGSIGYGIFRENMSTFGMTENQFNVLKIDAQAGEIQQIINSIESVSSSKVILSMPEESVFLRDEENNQATASVTIQFKPTARKEQATIDTIYNLVQKSVPNLPLENIAISDGSVDLIPSERLDGTQNSSNIATSQFDIKKRYETDIKSNVEDFLGTIMGHENIVVNVISTLNFDQENRQEKIFLPVNTVDQQGIERSVQEIQKSYTGGAANQSGGVPGTGEADVPTYQGNDAADTGSSEEMESIVNYEINEITKSIVSSPYVVQDLTIFAGIEPFDSEDPESLTDETKEEIKQMLVNIVSASLSGSNINFSQEELQSKVSVITRTFAGNPTHIQTAGQSIPLWLYALIGATVLALGAGVTYAIMKKKRLDEQQSAALEAEEETNRRPAVPSIDFDGNDNQVRRQLEMLAEKKPEEFVNLLRTWLADD